MIKLSFEAGKQSKQIKESDSFAVEALLEKARLDAEQLGFVVARSIKSPIVGAKGKNIEYLFHLRKLN